MSISDLIAKQAAAVKNGSNANKAADLLEEAAKLLRNGATSTVKLDFKATVKQKTSRLDRFGAAIAGGKEKALKQLLKTYGWEEVIPNPKPGSLVYGNKAKPGYKLEITGKYFTVTNGIDTIVPKSDVEFIETYLSRK